jgi:L,D-peptidoglycan transpeptidase YkuD (ErfK/YbiS/YcfS/YnhG family)
MLAFCVNGLAAGLPAGAATAPDTAAAIHPVRQTSADQVVVVSAPAWGSSSVTVTAYSWTPAGWQQALGPMPAFIGVNGFTATPHEADGFTPVGQYAFTTLFGRLANPGTAMPYTTATADDHWVDDPTSPVYNTWQTGPANGRWDSAETLSNYAYAAAFDFNQSPVVPDANSAIFFHGGTAPSPGCIEVGADDLLAVLRWLTPAAHPVIVLGVGAVPPAHTPAVVAPTTTSTTAAPAEPTPVVINAPTIPVLHTTPADDRHRPAMVVLVLAAVVALLAVARSAQAARRH